MQCLTLSGIFSPPPLTKKIIHLIWLYKYVFKFKNLNKWKVTPMTTYNTQFFFKNLFVLSNIGYFQKDTAYFWTGDSIFKFNPS